MTELMDYMTRHASICEKNDYIDKDLFDKYGVKKGLRDVSGEGVLTGLTNISTVMGFSFKDGKKTPCDGELLYRGYDIKEFIDKNRGKRFLFERAAYLLLFGDLPSDEQLDEFSHVLNKCMRLPTNFTRDVIMKAPNADIMNSMTRSILTIASYDKQLMDMSLPNVLRQCIELIAEFPMLAAYGYHAYNHYKNGKSMYIHRPDPKISIAENFLRMLRPDKKYTPLEAQALDIALLLHMEHGGGNNSTFTTRVVTSAGSDTYSSMSAAMCSLKGPKHGGANIMVMKMMQDLKSHVKGPNDIDGITKYLDDILEKRAFDSKGLIYGMGHAVYSLSDPREVVFKGFVERLAQEKNRNKEMQLYDNVERIAIQLITSKRKIYKGVSPNVDFYSGFAYDIMGIPVELYTPLFAIARIVGWSAHRIEEIVTAEKIIRPAYKSLSVRRVYEE